MRVNPSVSLNLYKKKTNIMLNSLKFLATANFEFLKKSECSCLPSEKDHFQNTSKNIPSQRYAYDKGIVSS